MSTDSKIKSEIKDNNKNKGKGFLKSRLPIPSASLKNEPILAHAPVVTNVLPAVCVHMQVLIGLPRVCAYGLRVLVAFGARAVMNEHDRDGRAHRFDRARQPSTPFRSANYRHYYNIFFFFL